MSKSVELSGSYSLLSKTDPCTEKQNQKPASDVRRCSTRRKIYIAVGIVCGLLLLLLCVTLVFLFADVTQSLRNSASEKLGISLKGYQKPASLREFVIEISFVLLLYMMSKLFYLCFGVWRVW